MCTTCVLHCVTLLGMALAAHPALVVPGWLVLTALAAARVYPSSVLWAPGHWPLSWRLKLDRESEEESKRNGLVIWDTFKLKVSTVTYSEELHFQVAKLGRSEENQKVRSKENQNEIGEAKKNFGTQGVFESEDRGWLMLKVRVFAAFILNKCVHSPCSQLGSSLPKRRDRFSSHERAVRKEKVRLPVLGWTSWGFIALT